MKTKRNKTKENLNIKELGVEIKFVNLHCCGCQCLSGYICLGGNDFLVTNRKWLNVDHQRDSAFQGNVA
jgi:hypothetical protein